MQNITIERSNINVEALDELLRATLGADYLGLSTRSGEITLHLVDSTTAADVEAATQLVQLHDESLLTTEQQEQIARGAEIDSARLVFTEALDLAQFDLSDPSVQQLAARLRWIEQEIRALRSA